ncbi:DUF6286 domain-containing protein [Streptomyces sp. NPDC088194]|uniref:DUF6286 domain-containing protein n=1 Tax=Streptomyces sp. NPDC088194 TaxID=3154931 RepID=UPI00344B998B
MSDYGSGPDRPADRHGDADGADGGRGPGGEGGGPSYGPGPDSGSGPSYRGGSDGGFGRSDEPEPTVKLPTLDTREPEPDTGAIQYAPAAGEPGAVRAKRFWSGRRVPAAITAALCTALTGLFLYDIAAVRTDRKAMAWRKTLARELATRHLDNVWIIVGAAVAAVVGLWLLLLAATPGERGVLPMARRGSQGVRAGLDRHAAELVLRDRAMEVAGVRWSRVKVSRRKVKARATSHFRELDDVRRDLTAALDTAAGQLGLAKALGMRVHVQRADKKA